MSAEERDDRRRRADGVHIVHRRERFPIRGTKAEKRAERGVAACFVLAALAGVGFIVAFIALPVAVAPAGHAAELPLLHPGRSAACSAALLLFMGLGAGAVGQVAHARGRGRSRTGTTSRPPTKTS